MNDGGRDLTRDEVLQLLTEVGQVLKEQGLEADIYVVGGAAMALEFDARRITRDVDSALRSDRDGFWEAVALVAERHNLSPRWINTQATAFFTTEPDDDASEITLPGLRIAVASPEHLIAMKLRAMRNRDMDDLEVLFRRAGITDPQQAADIHNRLFDDSYIGYSSPEEALYAAERVFTRAAAQGRPIPRRPST
ncbi:MAG: nucleotidyltransferase [Micrococcales bacterium]|nr:nucleotidyltransferase [Micrococcales bacterium]